MGSSASVAELPSWALDLLVHSRVAHLGLIDDRYDEGWSSLAWVQAIGQVTVPAAADAPGAIATLTDRYAQYRELPPAGPGLSLEPERVLWWRA